MKRCNYPWCICIQINFEPFFLYITRLHRARRSCDMYGSAATPRTENGVVTECAPSSYLLVYHSKFQRSVLKKEIVTLYRPTLVAVWAQDQGRTTAPTASIFVTELRVSRRHGRVCPEEQGRNLGRSVTPIYRLCSLVGRSYSRLQNFLGPICH